MAYLGHVYGDSLPYQFRVPDASATQDGVMTKEQFQLLQSIVAGSNATSIQGIPVDPGPPLEGQILVYNAALNKLIWVTMPGAVPQVYTCPAGAAIRDAVYRTGVAGVLDIADSTDRTKMPAAGFIVSKPSTTTCIIQDHGELAGWGGTLIPGRRYWFGPGGAISLSPPTADGNSVEQQAGFAATDSILDIQLGVSPEQKL